MEYGLYERSEFKATAFGAVVLSFVFIVIGILTVNFVPTVSVNASIQDAEEIAQTETQESDVKQFYEMISSEKNVSLLAEDTYMLDTDSDAIPTVLLNKNEFNTSAFFAETEDKSLLYYYDISTRSIVQNFYGQVTGNQSVSNAILEEAASRNIPISLAFALAWTESRFNSSAVNFNVNGSIDRGLFQLNDRTFTQLKPNDFFTPQISAEHGMKHLRYCLNVAKGDIGKALAMYNAGINRVLNNAIPQSTVSYVAKIISQKAKIESEFEETVVKGIEFGAIGIPVVAKNDTSVKQSPML